MNDHDERCCGTGTCIINAEGFCWCGQKWDGEKMCFPAPAGAAQAATGGPGPDSAHAGKTLAGGRDLGG